MILMAVISSIPTKAQSITGKVVDETDTPLAYANVILQKSDSTYIAGAVADTAGRFAIAAHPEAAWIQVTFIGYETQYRSLNELDLIRLVPDTEVHCNKPMVQLEFGNTFSFGKGFTFNADYTYISCGFWRDFEIVAPSHKVDVSVRKSFLNDAMSVELRGHDLLQAKDDIFTQTNVYSILQYNIRDTRKASLTIRYRFNSARSKYKGTGAGEQQKSRM